MEISGQLHPLAILFPERNPNTHSLQAWVYPAAGMDASEKRKILAPARN